MSQARSARLFAAVAFTPAEKRALGGISAELKGKCQGGRFPPEELFHITLHFFGQTSLSQLTSIEEAMKAAAAGAAPFQLVTGSADAFGRGDSAVLWLGLEQGAAELRALQARLEASLNEKGFPGEGKEFKAHITMGRDVRLPQDIKSIELPKLTLRAGAVTLMESTQARGRLEYIPLMTAPLTRG